MFEYFGNSAEINLPEAFKTKSLLEITGLYTLFKASRWPKYVSPPECHSAMELIYVSQGCVGLIADENQYIQPAGHISFHPAMEFHSVWTEGNDDAVIFVVSFDITGNLTHKFKSGVFSLSDRERSLLDSIIAYLDIKGPAYSELKEKDYLAFYQNKSEMISITAKMLEAFMTSFAVSQMHYIKPQNASTNLYTKIASILEQSVYGSVSIPEIAKKCGTSPTTVKNTVKSYAGYTVHKYLLKIKIRKAIELLQKGKNVSEVSDTLGFCNPNYFSQVFFRETGRHASDYK